MNTRISQAIANTKRVVPGYFEKTVEQRLPGGCGSVLEGDYNDISDVISALENAEWHEYTHESLMPGTTAYKTNDITGRLGIVDLANLPSDVEVTLDDRKNTGKVSATISGELGAKVDFVVIILGDEQGEEVVFTFHPGDPVRASQVTCEPGMHGKIISVREAQNLGLTTAKIIA